MKTKFQKSLLVCAYAVVILFAACKKESNSATPVSGESGKFSYDYNGTNVGASSKILITGETKEQILQQMFYSGASGHYGGYSFEDTLEYLSLGSTKVLQSNDTVNLYIRMKGNLSLYPLRDGLTIPIKTILESAFSKGNTAYLIFLDRNKKIDDDFSITSQSGSLSIEKYDKVNRVISGTFTSTIKGKKQGSETIITIDIKNGQFSNVTLQDLK
ncbi:MAG TPA: hypothetical protein VF691_09705 [Cytophagaceae bacterium]|jgi:hypothetical protein